MNRFPMWKYLVLVTVLVFGTLYALPNLYPPDPALQITANAKSAEVNERVLNKATKALDAAGIDHFGATISESGNALIRVKSFDDQSRGRKAVDEAINKATGESAFIIALNQASTTPAWLESLGAKPMNLGLDLAGGVHFLLEVDTYITVNSRMDDLKEQIRDEVIENKLYGTDIEIKNQALIIASKSEDHQDTLVEIIRKDLPNLSYQRSMVDGKFLITARMTEQAIAEIANHAISQNLSTIRNRVNELGVSEPVVQKQGKNRIVVELPGVQDTAQAKKILGKTANLEFRMEAKPGTSPIHKETFGWYKEEDQRASGPVELERRKIITGERVVGATSDFDPDSNSPRINITLDSEGGEKMHRATWGDNVGRRLGVLFIEFFPEEITVVENGERVTKTVMREEKKVISLATVREALGKQFQTTGLDSPREAQDVALLLRSGSLAAPMKYVEERTIGPSLGAENIAQGVMSVKIGLLLVVLFMIGFYKVFGIAANLALGLNLVLLTGIMSILGATLTLPGIAGIVLTVGMAVDANVLIFSRIKEELKSGMPNQAAIHGGFERAFTTIMDANITTLIVAFILFAVGTGPVKGFAVTLSIGILTSMFTAIWGTRAVINIIYGGRKVSKLWI